MLRSLTQSINDLLVKRNATGVNPATMSRLPGNVIYQCPDCAKQVEIPRTAEDHPTAMKCVLQCPDCDDGDFHEGRWFTASGEEVPSLDAGPGSDSHANDA